MQSSLLALLLGCYLFYLLKTIFHKYYSSAMLFVERAEIVVELCWNTVQAVTTDRNPVKWPFIRLEYAGEWMRLGIFDKERATFWHCTRDSLELEFYAVRPFCSFWIVVIIRWSYQKVQIAKISSINLRPTTERKENSWYHTDFVVSIDSYDFSWISLKFCSPENSNLDRILKYLIFLEIKIVFQYFWSSFILFGFFGFLKSSVIFWAFLEFFRIYFQLF